jgi:hypothetical protein
MQQGYNSPSPYQNAGIHDILQTGYRKIRSYPPGDIARGISLLRQRPVGPATFGLSLHVFKIAPATGTA